MIGGKEVILFLEHQLGSSLLFLNLIFNDRSSRPCIQGLLEPRAGKSIAQDHTVNEPVSGIHIKFCVTLKHMSHTGFKCLFNTLISSESTLEVVAKIQIK